MVRMQDRLGLSVDRRHWRHGAQGWRGGRVEVGVAMMMTTALKLSRVGDKASLPFDRVVLFHIGLAVSKGWLKGQRDL